MNKLLKHVRQKIYKAPFTFVLIAFVTITASLLMIAYVYEQGVKSKAAGETVTLSFNPATVSAAQGADFTTTIKADSTAMMIRGFNFKVAFNKSEVQVKTITYENPWSVSQGLGDDNLTLDTVNANGVIKIQGESHDAAGGPVSSGTSIVTITFTSNSSSAYAISFDITGGNFYKYDSTTYVLTPLACTSAGDLNVNGQGPSATPSPTVTPGGPTLTPTPTVTPGGPTLTPTPTPTPNVGGVNLNLKLKFQGILSKPADEYNNFKVHVTLISDSKVTSCGNGNFVADSNGIWSGSITDWMQSAMCSPPVPGSNFKIFVKGPKHLQKRVCDSTPTESWPGSYHCENGSITLVSGDNNLDFSGIYMLVGDLPDQNGVVDSYDISLVRNNVGSTDAKLLSEADLNLDGIVDSQDYSLVIAALSVRGDEGE